MSRWFRGGKLNTCYNALDVHVENGNGNRIALHYDSPLTNTKKSFTFAQMREKGIRAFGGLS